MKKQLFATFFGVTLVFNALAYLGPNDKMDKPNPKPKGANLVLPRPNYTWSSMM